MNDWKNYCETGGGEGTFVFYCHGMPWAVQTKNHPWNGSDKIQQSTIFGARSATVGATETFPHDSIPRLTLLNMPKGWKMNFDPASNWIDGGGLTVEIDDESRMGIDSSWYTDRSVYGLEGVHSITDYRVDTDIHVAFLTTSMLYNSTLLAVEGDVNDELYTKIAANITAEDPTYLWVGNECVAAVSALTDDGTGAFHVTVVRGILKTKPQNHIKNQHNTASIIVSDCPVGGLVARRPASLWYVPADTTAEPDRIWTGYSGTRMSRSRGKIKISCDHWINNLDTDYVVRSDRYRVKGYTVNTDWRGQMVIHERDPADGKWVTTKMKLDNGISYYENYDELVQAINDELQRLRAINALFYNYRLIGNKMSHVEDDYVSGMGVDWSEWASWVSGPLPWLLGIGAPIIAEYAKEKWVPFLSSGELAGIYNIVVRETGKSGNLISWTNRRVAWVDGKYYDSTVGAEVEPSFATSNWRAAWFMQDVRDGGGFSDLPLTDSKAQFFTPREAWHINPSTLVSSIDVNTILRAGPLDDPNRPDANAFSAEVTAINTTNNTITTGTIDKSSDNMRDFWGRDAMHYIPGVHDKIGGDQLVFTQQTYPQSEDFTELIKGTFGDPDSPLKLPKYTQIVHIPDMFAETVNGYREQVQTIDFDQMESLIDPIFWGHVYKVLERTTGDDFSEMLANELFFHGVAPTWRWDQSNHSYRMGFVRLGLPLENDAIIGGRLFVDEDRELYKPTKVHNSDGHTYNQLVASFGFQTATDDFANTMKIIDDTGLEYTGRKAKSLKIEAKFSTYDSNLDPQFSSGQSSDSIVTNIERATNFITVGDKAASSASGRSKLIGAAIGMEYTMRSEESNNALFTHLKNRVLRQYSYPIPLIESSSTIKANTEIELNGPFLASNSDIENPYTGEYGFSNVPARARSIDYVINGGGGKVSYTMGVRGYKGVSPSCIISASTITDDDTIEIDDTEFDSTDSYFSQDDNRPDLTFFDCYRWNESKDALALDTNCGCGDYSVTIFEINNPSPTFYRGTVGSIQLSSGTWIGTINSTDIGLTWDTTKDYVMIYGEFDDSDTENCQRIFAYFADEDGRLYDGSDYRKGDRWK